MVAAAAPADLAEMRTSEVVGGKVAEMGRVGGVVPGMTVGRIVDVPMENLRVSAVVATREDRIGAPRSSGVRSSAEAGVAEAEEIRRRPAGEPQEGGGRMALRLPAERVRVETRVTAAGSRKQIERPKPMKSDGMHTTASGAAFGAELAKEDFKFSAAHFTLFGPEKAEGLHGHNYRVEVAFWGDALDDLGFLADFAAVKTRIRGLCAAWDEKILIASDAPFLDVESVGESVQIRYADREYRVPAKETELLPIRNITVEALSQLFWQQLAGHPCWDSSKVRHLRVAISETSGQGASYAADLERSE